MADCATAAQALNLLTSGGQTAWTPSDDGQTSVNWDPPYCYFEVNQLKFNTGGTNTGACSDSDVCLCGGGVQSPATPPPPTPPAVPTGGPFTITDGFAFCEYVSSPPNFPGAFDCITDGAGDYGTMEDCSWTVNARINVTTVQYDIEQNYDFVTMNGTEYRFMGDMPPSIIFEEGTTLTWHSDSSVTRGGFLLCVDRFQPAPPAMSHLPCLYRPLRGARSNPTLAAAAKT